MLSQEINPLSEEELNRVTGIVKAIAHPVRLQILLLLKKNQAMYVTDIYQCLQLDQSLVSQNLIKMHDKGILGTRRTGKRIYYYLLDETLIEHIRPLIHR